MERSEAAVRDTAELVTYRQAFELMLQALRAALAAHERTPASPQALRRQIAGLVRDFRGHMLSPGPLGLDDDLQRIANTTMRSTADAISERIESLIGVPPRKRAPGA